MAGNKSKIQVGEALRERRRILDMTLKEVSQSSGISVGFLSQVERNLTTPSLSSLVNIAKTLGVGVDYFLTSPKTSGLVNRKGERNFFTIDGLPVRYARVSNELPRGKIFGIIAEVPPLWESERAAHEGEDFIYIIEGAEVVKVGEVEYTLNAGDTIHYDASIPHSWGNRTDTPTKSLFVGTQPLFPNPIKETNGNNK